jgi:hypothetical protein
MVKLKAEVLVHEDCENDFGMIAAGRGISLEEYLNRIFKQAIEKEYARILGSSNG